jgi:hypothetical protein
MIKSWAVRLGLCAVVGLFVVPASQSQAARLFGDTFESGAATTNVGAPWGFIANVGAGTTTYQTASNPFASGPFGGTTYADVTDSSASNGQIRLLSNTFADTSLSTNLTGQVSTYSFDFDDVGGLAGEPTASQGLIAGYYRAQANPDLNGAGRSYGVFLHTNASSQGTVTFTGNATPVVAYTPNTANTLFMLVNDSASTVTNYAASGHDLLAGNEDVWVANGSGTPTYLFTVPKVNTATPTIGGAGFRTFTGDIEHFQVDNVLVASGATFDRSSLVTFPTFTLDRNTGQVTMKNASAFPVTIKSYSIASAAGSLAVGSWNSIADHSDADSGGSFDPTNVWTKSSSLSTLLAESTTGSGGALALNGANPLNLGNVWTRTPYQDLVINYTLSDGSTGAAPISLTGTGPVRSDLNADGVINSADYQIYLAGSGTTFTGQTLVQSYLQGDLNGDGVNDFGDFRLFKADYDAVNGAGAFSRMVAGVPEPSTIVLVATAVVGIGLRGRCRKLVASLCLCLMGLTGVFVSSANATTPESFIATSLPTRLLLPTASTPRTLPCSSGLPSNRRQRPVPGSQAICPRSQVRTGIYLIRVRRGTRQ